MEMQKFTDNVGREWRFAINVTTITKVKKDCDGLNLAVLFDGKMQALRELLGDPCRLVEVLWSLLEHEAVKRDVTPESFGEGFAGDVLGVAADALIDGCINFFQSPQRRAQMQEIWKMAKQAVAIDQAESDAKLAELTPEKLLTLSASAGNSPASSALTPVNAPSAS